MMTSRDLRRHVPNHRAKKKHRKLGRRRTRRVGGSGGTRPELAAVDEESALDALLEKIRLGEAGNSMSPLRSVSGQLSPKVAALLPTVMPGELVQGELRLDSPLKIAVRCLGAPRLETLVFSFVDPGGTWNPRSLDAGAGSTLFGPPRNASERPGEDEHRKCSMSPSRKACGNELAELLPELRRGIYIVF
eukprot:2224598-Amphidinium_carterae.2